MVKNIVYLTSEQWETLRTTGSVTVGDITHIYDENNDYRVRYDAPDSNAVSYEPQSRSNDEQMQARRNLDLYREDYTDITDDYSWDTADEPIDTITTSTGDQYCKISDPADNHDYDSAMLNGAANSDNWSLAGSHSSFFFDDFKAGVIAVLADTASPVYNRGTRFTVAMTKGIWVLKQQGVTNYSVALLRRETEVIQIPAKYLPPFVSKEDLDEEINRAKAAEIRAQGAADSAAAQAAEAQAAANSAMAQAVEAKDAISAEVIRAQTAEAALGQADLALSAELQEEKARSLSADNELNEKIKDESNRAIAAEAALQSQIDDKDVAKVKIFTADYIHPEGAAIIPNLTYDMLTAINEAVENGFAVRIDSTIDGIITEHHTPIRTSKGLDNGKITTVLAFSSATCNYVQQQDGTVKTFYYKNDSPWKDF